MKDLIQTWLQWGGRGAAGTAAFLLLCYPFASSNGSPRPPFVEYVAGVILMVALLAMLAAALSVFPLLGAYAAMQKGRPTSEGVWLGVLLGPFGVVVELLLPTLEGERRADEFEPGKQPGPIKPSF